MEVATSGELDLSIRAKTVVHFAIEFLKWAPTDYLVTCPFFAMHASIEAYLAIKFKGLDTQREVTLADKLIVQMAVTFLTEKVLLSEFKTDTITQLEDKTIAHIRTIL